MATKRGRLLEQERRVAGPAIRFDLPRTFRGLWEGDYRYRVLYGGRGSAKSHQIAKALVVRAHERRRRILCTREFQSSIKDSVHPLLAHYINELGLSAFFTINREGIFHSNGSEFLFKGLRLNIGEIKSMEGIDICWVEEAQSISKLSWDTLVPTIRRPRSEIWVSFNPNLATDPTYEMFLVKPQPNAWVQKVTFRDNPWFPDVLREEMENRRAADLEGYQHIWEGELWTRSKLQILTNWRVEEFEAQPGWHGPYFGLDFGFSNDPLALVKCWIFDNVLYVEHCRGGRKIMNDELRRVVEEVPGAEDHTIRADSARPETIAHMNASEGPPLRVEAAEKWAGSVEDGIVHLQSYRAIVVHPRCELAIEEGKLWRFKADKLTGDPLRQPEKGNDNSWDAVRYSIEPIIKLSTKRLRPAILVTAPPGTPPPSSPAKPGKPVPRVEALRRGVRRLTRRDEP